MALGTLISKQQYHFYHVSPSSWQNLLCPKVWPINRFDSCSRPIFEKFENFKNKNYSIFDNFALFLLKLVSSTLSKNKQSKAYKSRFLFKNTSRGSLLFGSFSTYFDVSLPLCVFTPSTFFFPFSLYPFSLSLCHKVNIS